MSIILTLVLMALVTYGPRLAGFALSGRSVSSFWRRFLNFVPVAVFAALITPALPGDSGEVEVRLVSAIIASFVIWYRRSLWLGIVVGMSAFWLLRSL